MAGACAVACRLCSGLPPVGGGLPPVRWFAACAVVRRPCGGLPPVRRFAACAVVCRMAGSLAGLLARSLAGRAKKALFPCNPARRSASQPIPSWRSRCSWILDPGSWIQDPVSWITDPRSDTGSKILGPGSSTQNPGYWIQDPWCSILDHGCWIQDPASRILHSGSWIQDPGSRLLDH